MLEWRKPSRGNRGIALLSVDKYRNLSIHCRVDPGYDRGVYVHLMLFLGIFFLWPGVARASDPSFLCDLKFFLWCYYNLAT